MPAHGGLSPSPGFVSAANSTTAPLGGGATYTGTWEDISAWGLIVINGAADVAGTLYADFSDDGATGLDTYRAVQLSGGATGAWGIHTLVKVGRYFRVRVVNGASAQSSMTVTTTYSAVSLVAFPVSRAAQTVNDYSSALNVRLLSEPVLDESRGTHGDRSSVQKFGRNPDVAAATEEDIWSAGGAYTGFLTAASAVRIKTGGNAADDSAGAGARKVLIVGLDENWTQAQEEVTTAGTSASSPTSTTFIRVFRAYVTDAGAYGAANTGDVTIETTGGAVVALIAAGRGQTQLAVYTVPAGKTAYCRRTGASVDGAKATTVYYYQRRNADVVAAPFTGKRLWKAYEGLSGPIESEFSSYPSFPAKTDIWAAAVGPAGGAGVSASFDLVLVDD